MSNYLKNHTTFRSLYFLAAMMFFCSFANAQTIQEQYTTFQDEASDWQEYKLFKKGQMARFWKVVTDTLNAKNSSIAASEQKISELEVTITDLQAQLAEVKTSLEKTESEKNSIAFLGIGFSKAAYHGMVWTIIFALVGGVAALFFANVRSKNSASQAVKIKEEVARDFEDYREQSKQKQILMKRDLQTMLNVMEENNIKVSTLVGYRDSIKMS